MGCLESKSKEVPSEHGHGPVAFKGVHAWISKEASSWQLLPAGRFCRPPCAPGIHEVAKKSGTCEAVLKANFLSTPGIPGYVSAYCDKLEVLDAITDEEVFTLKNDVRFTRSGYSRQVRYKNYYIMQGGETCFTICEDNLWYLTNESGKWWSMEEHTMLVCEEVSQRHLFTMKGSAVEGSPNHVRIYQGPEVLASAQQDDVKGGPCGLGGFEIKLNAGIDVTLVLALVMTCNQHICRPMTEIQGGR